MEIRLLLMPKPEKNGWFAPEFKDSLNDQQLQEFIEANSIIEEFVNLKRLLDCVMNNSNEITVYRNSICDNLLEDFKNGNLPTRDKADKIYSNFNRLFLNYLSSTRTFVDHCETYISRKFREDSSKIISFKSFCSYHYDNSFSYRFFCHLRNYSQHCGFPIERIPFNTLFGVDNELYGELKVLFDRDKLLRTYDWKPILKKDIAKMDTEFDLTPLLKENESHYLDIENKTEKLLKDTFLNAADIIWKLTGHLKSEEKIAIIGIDFKFKENGEFDSGKGIVVPFDKIEAIQKI